MCSHSSVNPHYRSRQARAVQTEDESDETDLDTNNSRGFAVYGNKACPRQFVASEACAKQGSKPTDLARASRVKVGRHLFGNDCRPRSGTGLLNASKS
jgi:hypothetical protein